jgi:four helix bundle protein
MSTVKTYRELIAWQKSVDLAVHIYRITEEFPRSEQYGLTNQVRRAAVSVSSNIAEGQGRGTTNDFRRFLAIAYGSLQEVETQIIIAQQLGYLGDSAATEALDLCAETGRIINGLTRSLPSTTGSR